MNTSGKPRAVGLLKAALVVVIALRTRLKLRVRKSSKAVPFGFARPSSHWEPMILSRSRILGSARLPRGLSGLAALWNLARRFPALWGAASERLGRTHVYRS